MSDWTELNPGAGDIDGIQRAASGLDGLSDFLSELHCALREALAAASADVWSGEAADAWRERTDAPLVRISVLKNVLDEHSRALWGYYYAVDGIEEEGRSARRLITSDPSSTPTLEEMEDRAAAVTTLEGLAWERRTADTSVRNILGAQTAYPPSGLRDLAAAAGITDLSQLAELDITELMISAAQDPGGLSDAEWTLLADYLHDYQDDPDVMDRFYTELGGQGTLDLITSANQHFDGDKARQVCTDLRSGLSTGSADWTPARAETFRTELTSRILDFDPYTQPPSADSAIALDDLIALNFLLADPDNAPLGAELATSIATWVDTTERTMDGLAPWQIPATSTLLAGSPNASLLLPPGAASDAPHHQLQLDELYGGICVDLGGAALNGLSAHPDHALDWLTDPEVGTDRLRYWVEDRDYLTTGENFTGVTALWEGMRRASGGQLDPESYDQDVWQRIADTTAYMATKLSERDDFIAENLSADAGISVEQAMADMLPYYAGVPITSRLETNEYEKGQMLGSILFDGKRPLPAISPEVLSELLGISVTAGSNDSQALRTAIDRIYSQVTRAVDNGTLAADDALEYFLKIQGNLDGAGVGADLARALRYDQTVAAEAAGLSTAGGIGLSMISPGVGTAADTALSVLISQGFDQMNAQEKSTYDQLLEDYLSSGKSAAQDQERATLLGYVARFHDQLVAEGKIDGSPESIQDYINSIMDGYEDASGRSTSDAEHG